MATDGGTILILANELHYVVLVSCGWSSLRGLRRYVYVGRYISRYVKIALRFIIQNFFTTFVRTWQREVKIDCYDRQTGLLAGSSENF